MFTNLRVDLRFKLYKGRLCSEYQIPGTPRPGLCHFTYRSTSRLEGRFNSPRHPQNYPNDLNCTYLFLATPSQQVPASLILKVSATFCKPQYLSKT